MHENNSIPVMNSTRLFPAAKLNRIKRICLLFFCIAFMMSCISNNSSVRRRDKIAEKTRTEVIAFVEKYLQNRLRDSRIFVDDADGLTTITNDISGYKIDHSRIVTGKIDEGEFLDAIVPVYTLRGQTVMGYSHLLVINSSGSFAVVKIMNDIFRIHGISDGHVIAEVSTVDPDSPGFGCNECKEVIKLTYRDGNLIREE